MKAINLKDMTESMLQTYELMSEKNFENAEQSVEMLILKTYDRLITINKDLEQYQKKVDERDLQYKKYQGYDEYHSADKALAIRNGDDSKMSELFLSINTKEMMQKDLLYYELLYYHPLERMSLTKSNKVEIANIIKHELDKFYPLGISYFEGKKWDIYYTSTPIICVKEDYLMFANTLPDTYDVAGLEFHLSMLLEYVKRFLNNRLKMTVKTDRKMYFDWALLVVRIL